MGQVSPEEFQDYFSVDDEGAGGTAVVYCQDIPRFDLEKDVRISVVVEVRKIACFFALRNLSSPSCCY